MLSERNRTVVHKAFIQLLQLSLMEKAKINYFVDVVLAVSFLATFVTGLIKLPGFLFSIGISYRSIPLGILMNINPIHDLSGIIMIFMVFVHLALHWKWIAVTTKERFFKRA